MSPLSIAQYMVAAAFFTVALMHSLVWLRRRDADTQICFALTAAAAGANAMAEASMYRATSTETMAVALKWYVATSGIWIVGLIWFVVAYTRLGKIGRGSAVAISAIFVGAVVLNYFSRASLLYTQLSGLRTIQLAWGETIRLADGQDSPWRFVTEMALLAVFGLVIAGWRSLRRHGQPGRAWLFGGSVITFLVFFETHALLVDTGRMDSPYLSSYAFLGVVLVMSYDLATSAVRAAELSGRLRQKEGELQMAIATERNRIANDLHDSVTQTLFSTAAIAEALPDVWDRHPEEARRGLIELRQLTKGALAEMRSLLVELRPAALSAKTLNDLLRQLADATAGRSSIAVNLEAADQFEIGDDVKTALYRIAQEALNNVIRHGDASTATLCLSRSGGAIILSIGDDGRGFEITDGEPGHLGLEIMRERARAIGADLRIESKIEQGTMVTVRCSSKLGRGVDG